MSIGANGLVNSGYIGIADIAGTKLRFENATITAKQEIEARDLVMGDWDRDAYVYGKIEVGGSISGPVTESFVSALSGTSLLEWACGRVTDCGSLVTNDIHLYYFCGSDRLFNNLYVNSFNFSVSAGDVAQFSLDVVGTGANDFGTTSPTPVFQDAEKLLTWDKVNVSLLTPSSDTEGGDPGTFVGLGFSNFEFTVNNNIETLYGLGQANLFPFDIVPGIRQISGSMSVYNTPSFNGAEAFDRYCAGNESVLRFSLGSTCIGQTVDVDLRVRFHRIEPTLSPGAIVSTVGFTGVSHQSGSPWDIAP